MFEPLFSCTCFFSLYPGSTPTPQILFLSPSKVPQPEGLSSSSGLSPARWLGLAWGTGPALVLLVELGQLPGQLGAGGAWGRKAEEALQ